MQPIGDAGINKNIVIQAKQLLAGCALQRIAKERSKSCSTLHSPSDRFRCIGDTKIPQGL